MNAYNKAHEMLVMVARALGDDLLKEVAFIGGCTTGLLLTDEVSKEAVRYTDDVDLIVNVMGYPGWLKFQSKIKRRGFKESMEDDVNCRMRIEGLIVDFMPDDEAILGYSNRWYAQALKEAKPVVLESELIIQLVPPVLFLATKLEAYKGRGNNDPLQSRDIEDILTVFDGRKELIEEFNLVDANLKSYITYELSQLSEHSDFDYAVQTASQGQSDREELIFNRIDKIID